MKPKSIGIIGGAGPMAGAMLLEKIFSCASEKYHCHRDEDFPEVTLISYPFKEMLSHFNETITRQELDHCLKKLKENDCELVAIACNTLHSFLNKNLVNGFIHLIEVTKAELPEKSIPLVLCTSTSLKFKIHQQFFNCDYPISEIQQKLDLLIDEILKGQSREKLSKELCYLLKTTEQKVIILGCTELSLLKKFIVLPDKIIIDPLESLALKLLKESFT